MYTSNLKKIKEKKIKLENNKIQNIISLTFETTNNNKTHLKTITLTGNGKIKTKALV